MDFAELFTQSAREIVPLTWRRGLLFLFDYRGPFVDIAADEAMLREAIQRLARAAHDLLDDGFIFMSAQTDWNDSGTADIAISVAATGQRTDDAALSVVLQQLRLQERPRAEQATDGARVAFGVCPQTGAAVSFAANRTDGVLLALDLRVPAVLIDDGSTQPDAEGARAWLISDAPGAHQSLVRRLQRLGWATASFASPSEALEQLERLETGMARPSLVVGTESPGVSLDSMRALRSVLPRRTQVILATSLDAPPRSTGDPDVELRPLPFSPAELEELTHRLHGMAGPFSGDTMPAPLTFEDRPHALVVDDNGVNLLVASGMLQMAGFEVQTASGGLEAIERCRSVAPHLVLMDVHMPGMDGLQTTRRLRQLQHAGQLPRFAIVAATADAIEVGQAACRAAGMDGYLSKPLSLTAIEREIDRVLPGVRRKRAD